ncbi:MFS sugar transporter [Saccharibacillus sp. O23]|uniref:MFS transporter n=1 Tax=Saccharibacillus sp. O23 TaxID=2009338 RepID=UPI000B4E17BF|nr:MFS transporter [Saccharibacillus sp. O23]OWR29006.1 MFS sugar transporter [Saccharibacillus sp. O23]
MALSAKRSMFALLALAVSAFAIGTTEFISVGLLPLIAADLDIPVSLAGLTVTVYALGVAVGAPVLTSLFSGVARKKLLLGIMVAFVIGNALAAVSNGLTLLLIARVLSAFAHGVFMSIGSTIAADLVPENRRAGAVSIMFSGLTVATVTGVPLGTFIGQQFGWRAAFAAIVIVGIVALIANLILVPSSGLRGGTRTPVREQLKLARNGRLLLALLITALGYGGTFAVFTYLSPLLTGITGFDESVTALLLLLYGVFIAVGNLIGGRAANRDPLRALRIMFAVQAAILIALYFAAPFKAAGLIAVLAMGLFAFMNVPGLQVHAVNLAERLAPRAVDVASALNIAAFNAGIALGAYIGGIAAARGALLHTAWIGGGMVALAALLTGLAIRLERRANVGHDRKHAA